MSQSELVILDVSLKKADPVLHDIYFNGRNAVLHYQKPPLDLFNDPPFIVVGTKESLSSDAAAIEFINGCPRLKEWHKEILGKELKSFVTSEERFLDVDNWWDYFHPNGLYR